MVANLGRERARRQQLEDGIRGLHVRRSFGSSAMEYAWCDHDKREWPCPLLEKE